VKAPAVAEIARAIRRHPARAALVVLATTALAVVLLDGGSDDDGGSEARAGSGSGDLLGALRATVPLPHIDLRPDVPQDARGPRYALAQVRHGEHVEVHDSPDGEVAAILGDRTEFGSARTFWITKVRGDWFGVKASELANGQLGWIRDDTSVLELMETRFSIVADRSAHLLELRYGDRVLDRFAVTVGSPGSPTPLGQYSVTDGLAGEGVGPYYGCCILALTGHQPHLPPNWLGGDRIAIHGTPAPVGGANSAGCLRASNYDMVSLFARVPLGAPVFIRA
jgi:hypothetical protein